MNDTDEKIIDQTTLAEDVSSKIPYEFIRDQILVKPLDPIKVMKEFSKPIEKGETTDENGVVATDYDSVTTEVKEVDSDYRKGIVLKIPSSINDSVIPNIKIGDVVIFRDRTGVYFDLVKDSRLVRLYDVVAIER